MREKTEILDQKLLVFGKIVKKYKLSKEEIKNLIKVYDTHKKKLFSYGPRLAGRIAIEREMMSIIESTTAFNSIIKCMNDYINTSIEYNLCDPGPWNLSMIGCWMNDMKSGEYNPPHTHHDGSGYSSVLFTKVPDLINDAKDPHKFEDGNLALVGVDGMSSTWIKPKVGDLYLFRADHQHMVMPFKTKKKDAIRQSMSFNWVLEIIGTKTRIPCKRLSPRIYETGVNRNY
tara:strand:- start:120 stop:809 length:690 start_codon:yes stop_codon:yes gene_type:complete